MKRFRKLRIAPVHLLLVGLSVGTLVVAIVVLWWDVARQPMIPDNFSYSVDSVSSRLFYDVTTGKAESPQYAKTNLELAFERRNGQETLRSTLGTTTVSGQTNFTHSNQLIDAERGVYLADSTPSQAYILAPRGLVRGQGFEYRHPVYSAVATMDYQGEETIDGLEVYRYSARFKSPNMYLGNMESADVPVPSTSRLSYEPILRVWIEPTSGWMVKYYNEVTAHLISKANNTESGVYGHVTDVMSDESVAQHIAYAKNQKFKAVFMRQIAPSILLSVLLGMLIVGFVVHIRAKTIPIYGTVAVVLAISTAILIGWTTGVQPLMTFFTGPLTINPLVAICFMLGALAIASLYRNRKRAAIIVGIILSVFAGFQIASELGVVSFSVDLLFFRDAVLQQNQTALGRMSMYTAATFLLLGVGIIKAGFTSYRSSIHFARFLIGMVLTIGVLGLVLKLTRFDKLLIINFTEPFSIIPSLLFVVCAITLLQLFRTMNASPDTIASTLRAVRWPAIATIPLIVIGVWTQLERNSVMESSKASFGTQAAVFEKSLASKIANYTSTVSGAQALFGSSQEVTSAEFREYVASYLARQQAGLVDLGFARIVTDSSQQYVDDSNMQIFPQSTRPVRAPITYLESLSAGNHQRQGYDLLSDINLSETLDYARDTGKAIMSKRISSLQDNQTVGQRTFIVAPVYRNDTQIEAIHQKRTAIYGYVFAVADMQDLFVETVPRTTDDIAIAIYDGIGAKDETLLYGERHNIEPSIATIAETRTIFSTNRPWTIVYSAQAGYGVDPLKALLPSLIFLGGSLVYFTALTLVYFVASQRYVIRRDGSKKLNHSDF